MIDDKFDLSGKVNTDKKPFKQQRSGRSFGERSSYNDKKRPFKERTGSSDRNRSFGDRTNSDDRKRSFGSRSSEGSEGKREFSNRGDNPRFSKDRGFRDNKRFDNFKDRRNDSRPSKFESYAEKKTKPLYDANSSNEESVFEAKPVRAPRKEQCLEIGARFKVLIEDMTFEGLGVAKIDTVTKTGEEVKDFTLFIFGLIEGEQGFVEITKLDKKYGYAKVLRLFDENQSVYRTKPVCPLYGECGGCNLMHMNYKGQLVFKKKMVANTLKKIGNFTDIEVLDVIGMDGEPFEYRNKVQVPVCQKGFKMLSGFYKRDTHEVTPLDNCFIQTKLSTEIVKFTRNLLNEYGLKGYDEKRHTGDVRHILVRKNSTEKDVMVVLILMSKRILELPYLDEFIKKLTTRFPQVKSIIGNLNDKKGNTIMGSENFNIFGLDYFKDTLLDYKFKIGASSFYQVNHSQCEKLYSKAIELAKLDEEDVIIDAYCGIGTIGIICANHVKKVYGVEVVSEAIKNAKANLTFNKITNAEYVCAKAEDQIVKWMNLDIKPNVIFVDPPRKGCAQSFIETVIAMKINKVVYISCDPSTLARDMRLLVDAGYKASSVQPVDLFPQTNHIENIAVLTLEEE